MKNESSPVIQIANPKKIAKLMTAYEELKEYFKEDNISISYNLNEKEAYPFNTIGSVIFRGKAMKVNNCRWFSEILKLANNVAVTLYLDGTFEYCLTFIETMVTIPNGKEE